MCNLCDNFEIEDARHFILHCPFFQNEREPMYNEFNKVDDNSGTILNKCNTDMFYILFGRTVDGLKEYQMERIWLIVLEFVSSMYKDIVKRQRGIG